MAELKVVCSPEIPDGTLATMPKWSGQYLDREAYDGPNGELVCFYELGDHDDTSLAQEQFLNGCEWVLSYEVKGV